MKKYIYTLLLSIFAFATTAQVTPPVTPANASGIAQQISTLFGSNINVTTADISTFFNDQLVNLDQNCGWPDGQIGGYNNLTAQLSWPPVPGALKYRVQYLNLLTGATGHQSFNPSGSNTYLLNNIPDGLYIFTFQAMCGLSTRGSLGIIIADKDIMITISPNYDCNCRTVSNVGISDGFQLPAPAQFLLVLDDTTNGNAEDAVMEFTTEVVSTNLGNQVAAAIYPFCESGGMTEDNEVFYPEFDITGTMFIENGVLQMDLSPNIATYIRECKDITPHNANIRANQFALTTANTEVAILPNPIIDYFSIQGTSSTTGWIRYSLFGIEGQLVLSEEKQISSSDTWEIRASFPSDQAPGMYLLMVENGGMVSYHKVIKE